MRSASDFDQLPQHAQGERFDVLHACPQCPSPLAGGVARIPNAFCPYCRGEGLVDGPTLDRWQREINARAGV